jgi:hypothetical protein
MKTALIATIAASAVLAAPGALAATGATTTPLPPSAGDAVGALTSSENAVLAQLKAFPKLGSPASVSQWETGLKAAEATQTRAEANLDAELLSASKATTTKPPVAHVGSALSFRDSDGNPYSVRLVLVIDPAQGIDQSTTASAGDRFVAAVFKVTNTGGRQISNDADGIAAVVGSNAQSYTAGLDAAAECASFASSTSQLAPGQSFTGCVVFQLPTTVNVSKVDWSPATGATSAFGEWSVP